MEAAARHRTNPSSPSWPRRFVTVTGWSMIGPLTVCGTPASAQQAAESSPSRIDSPGSTMTAPAMQPSIDVRAPLATAPRVLIAVKASSRSTTLDLGPAVIRAAAAAAAADVDDARAPKRGPFQPQPALAQTKIDHAFAAAEIERCGGSGTLKFDPLPVWGDFVMGIFAVPYALHAIATGRCKLLSK